MTPSNFRLIRFGEKQGRVSEPPPKWSCRDRLLNIRMEAAGSRLFMCAMKWRH